MLESLAWVENTGAYITRMSDNTGAYITRMSPGLDKWRQENLDHSRRERWSKTYRLTSWTYHSHFHFDWKTSLYHVYFLYDSLISS